MAMPAPRGPLSYSEHLMGESLLLSSEFLLFANDSVQTPAADRIKYEIIERPNPELDYFTVANLEAVRPFVCIYPESVSITRIASQSIQFNGTVQMLFECGYDEAIDDDPTLENESQVLRWWKNRVGTILKEAFGAAHDSTFLLRRMNNLVWWTRSLIKPEDQHLGFACQAEWGPDEP